ncbi:50S ribosomal protein L31e [Candidatus Pacearchaeota archaeon]|nr:50S ribosomal protein L31e [Candidatus Pacearchaeota archaeon]
MADEKVLEREYVIPLRRHWLHVPHYERTGKAVKAIKQFIAKHMKVPDRDVYKVKLDVYFNNELWFKGRASPPHKIKVKARKEGELVHVTFVQEPKQVTFLKAKHGKRHKKAEVPVTPAEAPKETVEKTEEQKTEEKEKEQAVAQQSLKEAKQEVKAQKHVTKVDKAQHPQRMALKK